MWSTRRQARVLAMQALCEWDVQRGKSAAAIVELFEALEAPSEAIDPAVVLVERYWAGRESVDARIAKAATKWDLVRISPVDRNIMRVAVVEMLGDAVPPRVAIDEAIEIGREYGGADSARFINGVLDAVLRRIAEPPT